MDTEKLSIEKSMALFMKSPSVERSFCLGRIRFDFYDNNAVGFALDEKVVTKFFSEASVMDGRRISTRTARRIGFEEDGLCLAVTYEENDLRLIQQLRVTPDSPYLRLPGRESRGCPE